MTKRLCLFLSLSLPLSFYFLTSYWPLTSFLDLLFVRVCVLVCALVCALVLVLVLVCVLAFALVLVLTLALVLVLVLVLCPCALFERKIVKFAKRQTKNTCIIQYTACKDKDRNREGLGSR